MTIQRADSFTRANVASGWGSATDGHVWTINAGDGQSVASNEGVISGSTASTFATLGASLATADGEGLARIEVVDSTSTFGILLRFTDTSNYYLARYDGAGGIAFFKKVAGTSTTVGSYAFTQTNNFFWLRFRVQGSSISIRTWQDGTSEPSTWNYTTTDTALPGTGGAANKVGLYGFASTGNNSYDHFSVDDLASGIALTGTLASALGLSGALQVARPLAGRLDSALGLSGALQVARPLAGGVASAVGVAGALKVSRALTGQLDSTLTISGILTVNGQSGPEDEARRVPHRHIGRIEDQQGDVSLEGV